MKIPSVFYGPRSKVVPRVRKQAQQLLKTGEWGSYDPGSFLDTAEVHSLHFWRRTATDTRELAVSLRVAGRVVASNEDWTTFVPLDEDEGLSMLAEAPGLSLRWLFFEDFGLGLEFWEGGVELGRAEFHWQTADSQAVSPGLEARLSSTGVSLPTTLLIEAAKSVTAQTVAPTALRDLAACSLRLPAYAWLSPASVLDDSIDTARQQFPAAEDVDVDA